MLGRVWLVAASLSVTTVLAGSVAQASCLPAPPEVLWSYPAKGASDVPLNIDVWVVSPNRYPFTATLNGEWLNMDFHARVAAHMGPPELTANTDYVLRLEYDVDKPSEEPTVIEIAFRTGERLAPEPSAPSVLGHTVARGDSVGQCNDVLYLQGCFDTGQDTLLSLDVSGSDVEAWLVEHTAASALNAAWPAGCGMPTMLAGEVPSDACFKVQGIGDGGLLSPAVEYCPYLNPPPGASDAGADASALPPRSQPDASELPQDAPDASSLESDSGAAAPSEKSGSCGVSVANEHDQRGPALLALTLFSGWLVRRRSKSRP